MISQTEICDELQSIINNIEKFEIKVSSCCYEYTDYTEQGRCPECKENCDFIYNEDIQILYDGIKDLLTEDEILPSDFFNIMATAEGIV